MHPRRLDGCPAVFDSILFIHKTKETAEVRYDWHDLLNDEIEPDQEETSMSPQFTTLARRGVLRVGLITLICGWAVFAVFLWQVHEEAAKLITESAKPNEENIEKWGNEKIWSAKELLSQYPLESLADRLAYENQSVAQQSRDGAVELPRESAGLLTELEHSISMRVDFDTRTASLKMLHSDKVEQFISRQGKFGVSRMVEPKPLHLEPIPADVISFPASDFVYSYQEDAEKITPPNTTQQSSGAGSPMPGLDFLQELHQMGVINFVNISGFGYIRDRNHVAGFESHRFNRMPKAPSSIQNQNIKEPEKERWLIRRLELVSLLKHEKPAVYISEHLPRMDELKDAETRDLIPFEHRALIGLQAGEDLVSEATGNRVLLMGAVRAAKQCLDCHEIQRGALLGAFSYELQGDPPVQVKR
jgi:hypothetical protein